MGLHWYHLQKPQLAFGATFYGNQCIIVINIFFFIMITKAFTLCGLSSIFTELLCLFLLSTLFTSWRTVLINYNVFLIWCLSYAQVPLCNVVSFLPSRIRDVSYLPIEYLLYLFYFLLICCCKLVLDSGNKLINHKSYGLNAAIIQTT